jgi:hypothetical protein
VPFSSSHQAPSDACKVPGETVAYGFKEIKKKKQKLMKNQIILDKFTSFSILTQNFFTSFEILRATFRSRCSSS